MKNYVLNGAMRFDQNQEGGAYISAPTTEVYGLDQWRYCGGTSSNGVFYNIRAPFPSTFQGFKYCMQIGVSTQQTVIGVNDNMHIEYPIEGCNIADWSFGSSDAKTLTLSMWVMANVAGDYSIGLLNGINTRSYTTSFNIPTANVWSRVSVTIPGDTGGSWSTDPATFGAKILFSVGCGTGATAPTTETWLGAAYWVKAGTNQLITYAQNTCFYMTGVQLEIGSTMTDFEHLEYTDELLQLQRYYFKTFPQGVAVGNGKGLSGSITTTLNGTLVEFPVTMCGTQPVTIQTYNPINNNANWYNYNSSVDSGTCTFINISDKRACVFNNSAVPPSTIMCIHYVADARLGGS